MAVQDRMAEQAVTRAPGRLEAAAPVWRAIRAAVPALVVAVLALPGLGSRPLWYDEYTTWYATSLSTSDLFHLLGREDAVLGPYYIFMRGWTTLAGVSEASLRLPSALAMMAAAALVVLLGERLIGVRAGIAAGLLFAVLPNTTRYAQEARPYGLAMAAALLATLLLLRALEKPSWARWGGYAAVLAVTGLAHLVAVLIVLPHLVAVFWPPRDRRGMWRFLAAVAVAGAVCLPLVILGSGQSWAISWIHVTANSLRTFPTALAGSQTVAIAVATLALVGVVLTVGTHRRTVVLLLAWAIGPVLVCLVTAPILHLFLYRYLLFTLPAWCLLAATIVVVALNGRWLPIAAAAVVLVWVGYLALPGIDQAGGQPGEPDFRTAARMVAAHEQPGDGIVYGGSTRDARLDFSYELRSTPQPKDVLSAEPSQQVGTYDARECAHPDQCLAGTTRLWVIAVYPSKDHPYGQLSETVDRMLRENFSVQQRFLTTNVTVYLFNRTA
jgi:mannosyltransferase